MITTKIEKRFGIYDVVSRMVSMVRASSIIVGVSYGMLAVNINDNFTTVGNAIEFNFNLLKYHIWLQLGTIPTYLMSVEAGSCLGATNDYVTT